MRFNALLVFVAVSITSIALVGCTPASAPKTTRVNYGSGVKVSGVITYRERIALPDNAVVTARLLDVSSAEAPVALSEQIINNPGQVPVPFVLTSPSDKIDQNCNYVIEATIKVGGQVRWKNTQQYGVITRGNPLNGLMVWVQQVD